MSRADLFALKVDISEPSVYCQHHIGRKLNLALGGGPALLQLVKVESRTALLNKVHKLKLRRKRLHQCWDQDFRYADADSSVMGNCVWGLQACSFRRTVTDVGECKAGENV